MPAFRSVVSALVSLVGRSFSTNSRPALRAAAPLTTGRRPGLADYHADTRRLDRRMATIAEAHPLRYAVAVGLVAGALAFLIGWIARREWIWFLFVMGAIVAGASTYIGTR
jgi:hypothetical protein